MGKWIHRLSNLNLNEKTATCKKCGSIHIKYKGRIWRCVNSIRENKHPHNKLREFHKEKSTGICPICNMFYEKLVYDHDHLTGRFRGWICRDCNLALGLFRDRTESLENAIKYLNKESPEELSSGLSYLIC